jgi:hypothetical protein
VSCRLSHVEYVCCLDENSELSNSEDVLLVNEEIGPFSGTHYVPVNQSSFNCVRLVIHLPTSVLWTLACFINFRETRRKIPAIGFISVQCFLKCVFFHFFFLNSSSLRRIKQIHIFPVLITAWYVSYMNAVLTICV